MCFYNITHQINDHILYVWEVIDTLDINYWKWVLWVVYPIIISFLLPLLILLFLYASALFLNLYNYRQRLREAYERDFWDGARKTLAALWDGQARLWHGMVTIPKYTYNTVNLSKPNTNWTNKCVRNTQVTYCTGLYL